MKEKIEQIIKSNRVLHKVALNSRNKVLTPRVTVKKKIAGTNNKLQFSANSGFSHVTIDMVGNDNRIEIDDLCFFNNVTFFIRGNNNLIRIGKEVQFSSGGSLWIEDEYCEILIGERSTFIDAHIAVTEPNSKIIVGKDCLFAYDIDIRTGDSHSIVDTQTNKRINYAKTVHIGNHVWVTAHVSILKGVSIQDNCVVATRSVITKSWDKEGIIIGGNPERILREGITWERQRIYNTP